MELQEFKKEYIKEELGITENFGKVISFVDFGNVNYWFEEDNQSYEHILLKDDEKLSIDILKLKEFLKIFSNDVRFYYGYDSLRKKSIYFIQKAEEVFGKNRVFSKQVQKIRHYLETDIERNLNTRTLQRDGVGDFVHIPKCNFDVEISVDAIKIIEHYDTVCLLSSDADFVHLLRFLKQRGKRVILIKGGHVVHNLKKVADIVISAQDIKKHITTIKQKPDIKSGLADRNPESTGRTTIKP